MQPLALLEQNQSGTACYGNCQYNQCENESCQTVGYDKADYGNAYRSCRPIDVSSLNTHKFKGTLKPLEQWIIGIVFLSAVHTACALRETEEQRKCLGCRNEEDTGSDHHHDLLLEILLIVCNVLIFNIYRVSEMEKETKWKQQNQETPK